MGSLTLVVVTYLGIVIQAKPTPVRLDECRAGIAGYRANYLKSWVAAGFDSSGIKITCEPVGTVVLVRRDCL